MTKFLHKNKLLIELNKPNLSFKYIYDFRLEEVTPSESGVYTCHADNGISPAASAKTKVNIQCKFFKGR